MENINLIRKVAWSFHKTTGVEFDELFQEAALAYLEANDSYNCTRGKFTSYCWMYMVSYLKNYIKALKKQHSIVFEDLKAADAPVEKEFLFEYLSKDAQQMVYIMVTGSKPYLNALPEEARQRIVNVMKANGWSLNRIMNGLNDIEQALHLKA